jgi:hypothetical protein
VDIFHRIPRPELLAWHPSQPIFDREEAGWAAGASSWGVSCADFYEPVGRMLFGLIYLITGSGEESGDTRQEGFMTLATLGLEEAHRRPRAPSCPALRLTGFDSGAENCAHSSRAQRTISANRAHYMRRGV